MCLESEREKEMLAINGHFFYQILIQFRVSLKIFFHSPGQKSCENDIRWYSRDKSRPGMFSFVMEFNRWQTTGGWKNFLI